MERSSRHNLEIELPLRIRLRKDINVEPIKLVTRKLVRLIL